jgi:peptide/nickel transport system permease protein
MWKHLFRRILVSLLILLGVWTLTFFLMHLAPGDPTALYLDPRIPPEVQEKIRHQMGLDRPVLVQYAQWIKGVLRGDLGYSFSRHGPVKEILKEAIPRTLLLTMTALTIESLLALFLGVLAALKRHTWFDRTVNSLAIFFFSVPEFWLGLFAIYLFSLKLGWLPASHMNSIDFAQLSLFEKIGDILRHLILPAFVLSISSLAYSMRLVRASMIETLESESIRFLQAAGVSEKKIHFFYAVKPSILPFITHLGMSLPFLFSGAFIVENIFSWPGMGQITLSAIFARDYPLIMGVDILVSTMVVVGNLLADLAYMLIDPRIRAT